MRQWIKGNPRLAVEYDGKKYYFPGAEQAQMFEKDPLRYVPVLNGDDIVHFVHTGKRVEGKLAHGMMHAGRTFFFATAENMQRFRTAPAVYANADLALKGECIVCRTDMNQRVQGLPDYTAIYQGLRYQFPGEEQRAAFLRSPDRYVKALSAPGGSDSRAVIPNGPIVNGSGTSSPSPAGSGTR
jgi:YHS domain-containing protein